jgi:uncharacterized protein (TIGR00156 family)
MKQKKLVCLVILITIAGLTIHAQGYTGPGVEAKTVAEARTLWNGSHVALQGKIVRFIGDGVYEFVDDTGRIYIKINNSLWENITINQNDTVEIAGEIEGIFRWSIIEVKTIRKL